MTTQSCTSLRRGALALLAALALFAASTGAQDRLKTMPGYEQFARSEQGGRRRRQVGQPVGDLEGRRDTRVPQKDGKLIRYDLAEEAGGRDRAGAGTGRRRQRGAARGQGGGAPERGRQVASTPSPDGRLKAFYRDSNLWLASRRRQRDGGHDRRQRRPGHGSSTGTASWVYGEELCADDRDVVVARQQQGRLLPLRREGRGRLSPPTQSDEALQPRRHGGLPESGPPQPGGRPLRLRRRRRRRPRSTSATASRSTTPSSGTTCIASPGRPMAPSSCSTAPTAARTSWRSSPPTPRPGRAA